MENQEVKRQADEEQKEEKKYVRRGRGEEGA